MAHGKAPFPAPLDIQRRWGRSCRHTKARAANGSGAQRGAASPEPRGTAGTAGARGGGGGGTRGAWNLARSSGRSAQRLAHTRGRRAHGACTPRETCSRTCGGAFASADGQRVHTTQRSLGTAHRSLGDVRTQAGARASLTAGASETGKPASSRKQDPGTAAQTCTQPGTNALLKQDVCPKTHRRGHTVQTQQVSLHSKTGSAPRVHWTEATCLDCDTRPTSNLSKWVNYKFTGFKMHEKRLPGNRKQRIAKGVENERGVRGESRPSV
ncbi:uncharacterized protein LOC108348739 [Rattus norvegicus]|uniref:uncharacterized protein LOC108348739 n=1 Tax=Rattus norvegicus TaxID=10116 RepID=UPI002FD874FF